MRTHIIDPNAGPSSFRYGLKIKLTQSSGELTARVLEALEDKRFDKDFSNQHLKT